MHVRFKSIQSMIIVYQRRFDRNSTMQHNAEISVVFQNGGKLREIGWPSFLYWLISNIPEGRWTKFLLFSSAKMSSLYAKTEIKAMVL